MECALEYVTGFEESEKTLALTVTLKMKWNETLDSNPPHNPAKLLRICHSHTHATNLRGKCYSDVHLLKYSTLVISYREIFKFKALSERLSEWWCFGFIYIMMFWTVMMELIWRNSFSVRWPIKSWPTSAQKKSV